MLVISLRLLVLLDVLECHQRIENVLLHRVEILISGLHSFTSCRYLSWLMVAAITLVEVTPFSCSICLRNYTLWSLDVHNSASSCITRTITISLCCFFFILQNCWHHHHSFSSRLAEIKSNWINYTTTVVCRCNLDTYFLSEWSKYLLLLCSELYRVRFCAYINYGKRTTAVFFATMHRIVLGEILCLAINYGKRTTAVFDDSAFLSSFCIVYHHLKPASHCL